MSLQEISFGKTFQNVPVLVGTEAISASFSGFHTPSASTTITQSPAKMIPVRLEIPGVHFALPEQNFRLSVIGNKYIIENYPTIPWPKILIEKALTSDTINLSTFPSGNTVEARVLFSRFCFYLNKAQKCSLKSPSLNNVFENVSINQVLGPTWQQFLYAAKIYRKIRYIESVFSGRFLLTDKFSGNDLALIEIVFRGITEGEFILRSNELNFSLSFQQGIDATKPLFPGIVPISIPFDNYKIELFDQQLELGPATVSTEKAELANPRVIEQIRKDPNQPVDLRFALLDHQIKFHFERYVARGKKALARKLTEFKYNLSRQEPKELVNLVNESLLDEVSPDEAEQIAMDWLLYNDLPDRYCPQDAIFDASDAKRGRWRVPIWLMYADGRGGFVDEIVIDVKTGIILKQPSVEELRTKGLSLSKSLSISEKNQEKTKLAFYRGQEQHWITEHREEYVGQWVALDGDRLLSNGTNAREVYEAARRLGVEIPFVERIEPTDGFPFVGGW